jgi:hypothetical protein
MIIIKINKNMCEQSYLNIATLLFNMELGKRAFNIFGELDDPDDDFHVIHKDGISYTIQGIIGNIIVMCNQKKRKENKEVIKSLMLNLDKIMYELDDVYIKEYGSIQQYTGKSLDYTLVSESYTKKNTDRRKFIHNQDTMSNKSHYIWKIIVDEQEILFGDAGKYDRNMWEYTELIKYNTLIIDTDDVFETSTNITFIDGVPEIKHYIMAKRFINYDVLAYNVKYGGVRNILHKVKDPEYKQEDQGNIEAIFTPIYAEVWENINPMRIVRGNDNSNITDRILKLLYMSYDYILAEFDEIKNVRAGAPPIPNNECQVCGMYLYDDIYVLEKGKNHICVCAICFHTQIDHQKLFTISRYVQILRVTYPKTVVDIINTIDMSEDFRSLMLELSGDSVTISSTVSGDVITTPNYMGYSNMESILLKVVLPPEGKKLFICKILY